LATLPLLAGVGLCRALDAYLPGRVGLKWPNDLVVAGRKLGGILIETRLRPGEPATAILGFGVNQGQGAGDLPVLETGAATSLRLEGAEAALPELTWGLVAGVERELQRLGDFPYAVAAYRERSVHRQGERLVCRAGEERVAGIFRGFDERGLLLLDVAGPAGERRLHLAAGEVVEAVETRGVRNVD
jgi:BirA family biotin operon repressor/biotin-[acetyl-CoA-carboxylase] ligase